MTRSSAASIGARKEATAASAATNFTDHAVPMVAPVSRWILPPVWRIGDTDSVSGIATRAGEVAGIRARSYGANTSMVVV
jgi:hypothetical protein